MRRPLGSFAGPAAFFIATTWMASAKADGYTPPSLVITPQLRAREPDLFEKLLLSEPTFVSAGVVGSLANPEAHDTVGGEISISRWFGDTLLATESDFLMPSAGAYAEWEYIPVGRQTRLSLGPQFNLGPIGIETGYAFATLQEGRPNVHAVQITPFFSVGAAYVGARVLAPFTSGAPLTAMLVLGFKIPHNIGKKVDVIGMNHLH